MNRLHRSLHTALALTLGLLLLGGTGCKKQPFVQTVEQTLYLGLPASAEGFLSLDSERLRQVEGFNDFVTAFESNAGLKPVFDALRTKVGFDPWKDMSLVNLAFRGPRDTKNPEKNAILIVRGNFKNPTPKLDKLRAWLGEEYLADIKSRTGQHSAGFPTYQITGKSQYDVKKSYELNFAFPTESLLVFSCASALLNDTLDVIAGQAEGLQKDKAWMETLKRPNIGATIWGIGNIPAAATAELAANTPEMAEPLRAAKQGLFDINFSPDFVFHIGIVMDGIEPATKLADKLRDGYTKGAAMLPLLLAQFQIPETTKALSNVKIMNELDTVNISLKISPENQRLISEELNKLQEKAKAGKIPIPGLPGMSPGVQSGTQSAPGGGGSSPAAPGGIPGIPLPPSGDGGAKK